MKLREIQNSQHRLTLIHRNLDVVLQSEDFDLAWNTATIKQRKEAYSFITKIQIDELKKWTKSILFNIDGHTIRELRILASQNHIINYSRMSKEDLISVLTKKGIKNGQT